MKHINDTWNRFKNALYPYRYFIYIADVVGVLLLITLLFLGY